jgi:hypothetical protein
MRAVTIAATILLGAFAPTSGTFAQILAPGMPMPGAAPPPQQQQAPPCFKDFIPLRQEAEKRALALKAGMEKKVTRDEACTLFKQFSAAEAKVVKFVVENSQWCGIPAEAGTAMKANHSRTLKTQKQVCEGGGLAGAPKPSGPGLSEALGTTRSGATFDPSAPQSGTMNTLTGNPLSR